MAVNWGALGAFAAGAALLVGYELLRPRIAMAAPSPPPIAPSPPGPPSPPAPPAPPMTTPPTPPSQPSRAGYDLDSGDRLSIYVRGPRAQAATTNDEIREAFRRLGYDVLVTWDNPGTPEFAYRNVDVVGATYQAELVPADLATDIRVSSATTSTGSPKGMIQS